MSDETPLSAAQSQSTAEPARDDPPTPEYAELMQNIEHYDEATLHRLLTKLAERSAVEAPAADRDANPPTRPPPPPPTPPLLQTESLAERLLAVFPDACPEWVRNEAAKFEASLPPAPPPGAGAAPAEIDPEPLVNHWLAHGYQKRLKKWQQQRQLEQQEKEQREQPTANDVEDTAVACDPDEGTMFDWRRQQRDFKLRQPVFDALAQEFPMVALRSLSQVVKAFKYCLPAAYRFVYKTLAFTGYLAVPGHDDAMGTADVTAAASHQTTISVSQAVALAQAADDSALGAAQLPFDCPQVLHISSSRGASSGANSTTASAAIGPPPGSGTVNELSSSCLRRRPSELERQHPELLTELRFVRSLLADETVAAVAASAVATTAADAGAAASGSSTVDANSQQQYECECCFGEFAFDVMCQCPEGHLFCRDCLMSYVKEKVFGTGRLTLQCLAPNCDRAFLRSQLCLAVDAATLARLDERAAEDSVRGLRTLFRCPACGWGAEVGDDEGDDGASTSVAGASTSAAGGISASASVAGASTSAACGISASAAGTSASAAGTSASSAGTYTSANGTSATAGASSSAAGTSVSASAATAEQPSTSFDQCGINLNNKVFTCQNCEKEVCRLCGVDWEEHFGKRCSEIECDTETRLRREFEERMTQARVRICYQCNASVMKSSGCNHITCRCGAHFCYICREALPAQDPYSHFCNHGNQANCNTCSRCPVQSSTEEDEQRAIRELQAQGLKRQREEGFQERPIGPDEAPKRPRRS